MPIWCFRPTPPTRCWWQRSGRRARSLLTCKRKSASFTTVSIRSACVPQRWCYGEISRAVERVQDGRRGADLRQPGSRAASGVPYLHAGVAESPGGKAAGANCHRGRRRAELQPAAWREQNLETGDAGGSGRQTRPVARALRWEDSVCDFHRLDAGVAGACISDLSVRAVLVDDGRDECWVLCCRLARRRSKK